MKSLSHALHVLLQISLVCLISFVFLGYYFLATPIGSYQLVQIAGMWAGFNLHAKQWDGHFLKLIRVTELTLKTERFTLTAKKAAIHVNAKALWNELLHIKAISVSDGELQIFPSNSRPHLPTLSPIQIDHALFKNINIRRKNTLVLLPLFDADLSPRHLVVRDAVWGLPKDRLIHTSLDLKLENDHWEGNGSLSHLPDWHIPMHFILQTYPTPIFDIQTTNIMLPEQKKTMTGSMDIHYDGKTAWTLEGHFKTPDQQEALTFAFHTHPLLRWHVSLPSLAHWTTHHSGQLNTQGLWDNETQHIKANLSALDLNTPDQTWKKLTANIEGKENNHRIRAEANHTHGHVLLDVEGSYQANTWKGLWKEFTFSPSTTGTYRLQKPFRVEYQNNHHWQIDPLCLQSNRERLCFEAIHKTDKKNIHLSLQKIRLEPWLSLFLPQTTRIITELNAEAHSEGKTLFEKANFSLTTSPVRIETLLEKPILRGPLQLQGNWDIQNGGTLKGIWRDANNQPACQWQGKLNPLPHIHGEITVTVDNLKTLPIPNEYANILRGRLETHWQYSALDKNPFTGNATFRQVSLEVPALQNTFSVESCGLNKNNGWYIQCQAQSKEGKSIYLTTKHANNTTSWSLQGGPFLLDNAPGNVLWISPNLHWTCTKNKCELSGTLTIPQADIEREHEEKVLTITSDIINPPHKQEASFLETFFQPHTIHASLSLLPKVHFRFGRLNTFLEGNVRFSKPPYHLTRGTGEIHLVGGSYSAQGQVLRIRRGDLLFQNNLISNPGLFVEAIRPILGVGQPAILARAAAITSLHGRLNNMTHQPIQRPEVVGVRVRGTLRQQRVELFSEPMLPPSMILSYLLLGHAIEGGDANQSQFLMQAASAFKSRLFGGSDLKKEIQDNLGLDEVSVIAEEGPTTQDPNKEGSAMVIGKYVTPKIYLTYSYGFMDTLQTLRLFYQFTRSMILQADTNGTAAGADVLYVMERDKKKNAVTP